MSNHTYHFTAEEYWGDGADLLVGKFNAPDDETAVKRCTAICRGFIDAHGATGDDTDEDRPDCMSVTLRRGYDEYGDEIAKVEL